MLPKVKFWRDAGDKPYRKKPPIRGKATTPPHPQPTHSISIPY
jgi:hypothetical protein